MQRPSYPKETLDQWSPIAGDHSQRGGACNQSINAGCSLGERYNLMRQTHTHQPPLSDFLLLSAFSPSSSRHLFFSSLSCHLSFHWALSSVTVPAPLCHSVPSSSSTHLPPSRPPPPPPIDISKIPRGQTTAHKGKECSWTGAEEGGGDDEEEKGEEEEGRPLGDRDKEGEGRGRLMAQGQDGFWRQSGLQYLGVVRLAALRSSHEAESAWATAGRAVYGSIHF